MAEPITPGKRNAFSGLSPSTFLLAFTSLFADVASEMLYPIVPVYLTQNLKANGSIVGIVEGIAEATQNIMQGLSGWLSDHLHSRKPIALVGYSLAAVAKPLVGFSTVWQGVLGGRFLDRLGTGIRSAPRDALIAGSAEKGAQGKAFGLEGVGDNAGAFLGPLLTVALLTYTAIEMRTIFFLAIIPGVLAVAMIAFVKEKSDDSVLAPKERFAFRKLPTRYWKYLAAIAVFGIGNSSNSFLILRIKEMGASLPTTILIYAGFNLVAALISFPAGALSDRIGKKSVLIIAFAVFCLAYLGFGFAGSLLLLAALFGLYGVFQGAYRAAGKAFASDLVPEHLRATGMGGYGMTVGLFGLVASAVAGVLWDRVGHLAVFYFGAIAGLAGIVALLILCPEQKRNA